MNQFSIPNPTFPLLQNAVTFRAPVCMYANKYIHKYIHINCACELRFHQHRPHLHSETCLHTDTHLSALFFVCASFFVAVERATSSQRTTGEGQVRLAAPAAQTALYVQCRCSASLRLTSPGVGQQMAHLERELTYGSQLSSWSLHGKKSSLYFREQRGMSTTR